MDMIFTVGMLIALVLLGALTILHRAYLKYGSNPFQGIETDDVAIPAPLPPSLLTIPAELRNEIYRLTMISNEQIKITASYREPALLSVCPQIRDEATPIHYLNSHWVRLLECIPSAPAEGYQNSYNYLRRSEIYSCHADQRPVSHNLFV